MLINNWDILNAGARQWNVTPGYHAISNSSDWSGGSLSPLFLRNELGVKKIKVLLMIKREGGRQEILARCSDILSRLVEPAELKLDDFEHRFYGVLENYSLEENPMKISSVNFNRMAKLTLEFGCYEFAVLENGDPFSVLADGETSMVINNTGNLLTPAIVEITPKIGAASVTLTGICRDLGTLQPLPVTIRELKTGKTVVLDGESGLFTQEGELKAELDIWERPTLLPGENRITINNNQMILTVRMRPRFM